MAKDVKKKNTSKKAAKVQKEESKVTVEKAKVTNKKLKKETKKSKKKEPKKSYSSEVKAELKKVNWPSKQDLTKYGVATIIFIAFYIYTNRIW